MTRSDLARDLLDLATGGAMALVVNRVVDLVDDGWTPEDVLTDVLAPMQLEVGRLWEANRLTVAQEHAVTAVVDAALEALSIMAPPTRGTTGRLAVVCTEGEWHVLPARMAAQRWRWRGWDVLFLGGSIPAPDLGAWLDRSRPDALACSCSMSVHLPGLLRMAESAGAAEVPLVAGGAGTGPDSTACTLLGIRWAADVDALQAALESPPPEPDGSQLFARRAEADDLLSAIDDLVDAAMGVLRERVPTVHADSAAQRDRTVDDLRRAVHYLVAAVLAGDARLFTEFVAWRGRVLTSRGVDGDLQAQALAALAAVLWDFDLAYAYVSAGEG